MTLVVQNDSGTVTNANSYCDIAFADAYHTARGNSTWVAKSDEAKSIDLVKAAQYMDTTYEYLGVRVLSSQSTIFPRRCIYDELGTEITGIPTDIKNAQCEYALSSSNGDLDTDITSVDAFPVKRSTKKSNSKELTKEYDTRRGVQKGIYPKGYKWLKRYICNAIIRGFYG